MSPDARRRMIIEQPEFPGMPEAAPYAEHQKASDFALRLEMLTEENGPLVPQHMLVDVLGVSKQRVHQYLSSGRLQVFEILGTKFVPLGAVRDFKRLPGGRPKKETA